VFGAFATATRVTINGEGRESNLLDPCLTKCRHYIAIDYQPHLESPGPKAFNDHNCRQNRFLSFPLHCESGKSTNFQTVMRLLTPYDILNKKPTTKVFIVSCMSFLQVETVRAGRGVYAPPV